MLLLQYTFQAVLATDGTASFAIFLYGDITTLLDLSNAQRTQIGFNGGDGEHMSNIPVNSLEPVNIYRIDGRYTQHLHIGECHNR